MVSTPRPIFESEARRGCEEPTQGRSDLLAYEAKENLVPPARSGKSRQSPMHQLASCIYNYTIGATAMENREVLLRTNARQEIPRKNANISALSTQVRKELKIATTIFFSTTCEIARTGCGGTRPVSNQ